MYVKTTRAAQNGVWGVWGGGRGRDAGGVTYNIIKRHPTLERRGCQLAEQRTYLLLVSNNCYAQNHFRTSVTAD